MQGHLMRYADRLQLSGNPTLKIMGLFIVIFTNTPRNYPNLIFAGIPFIFTLQRYMYIVPILKQKKKKHSFTSNFWLHSLKDITTTVVEIMRL